MKKKNRTVPFIRTFIIIIVVISTAIRIYADEKKILINEEQKKEIFILKVDDDISINWCGNNAILVNSKKFGLEWIDILKNKKVKITTNGNDYPFNCTPDGSWVVYRDSNSSRFDKGHKPPKNMEIPVWDGGIVDLYRYEVATGKRQKFAVVRDVGPFEIISPDGSKVFLGAKHNSAIKMPEPIWDVMWFKNDWNQTHAIWFTDSSGIITLEHHPSRICVEIFGGNGWSKEFKTKFGQIVQLKVDKKNNFYFIEEKKEGTFLYRCNIKKGHFFYENIFKHNRYFKYDILPDGDIIFLEVGGNCVRYYISGQLDTKCITGELDGHYLRIGGLSRDGKWLAFIRQKGSITTGGGFFPSQSSLFVIKLSKE